MESAAVTRKAMIFWLLKLCLEMNLLQNDFSNKSLDAVNVKKKFESTSLLETDKNLFVKESNFTSKVGSFTANHSIIDSFHCNKKN